MKRIAFLVLITLLIGCGGGGGGGGDATNGSTPIANVTSATAISVNDAMLNGTLIPNGLSTQAWFEYGTDPSLTNHSSTTQQSIGSGLSIVPVSLQITGLAGNTTYYFRVCASNAKGGTESSTTSFTTSSPGAAPAVTTLAATSVGANTATLNANVTANGMATTAWFEWGTNSALSTFTSTSSQSIGSGTTSQSVSAALTGLSGGTTYYYRVVASSSSGTTKGSILSFSPAAGPTVTTLSASLISPDLADLNGNVNPNGLLTSAWFEWGTDPNLSSFSTTPLQSVGSSTTTLHINGFAYNLPANTTFYYRIAASNSTGTIKGAIVSFATITPPLVNTLAITRVSKDNTILNGNVVPNGLPTSAWFEWGTESNLSSYSETPLQSVGSGTSTQNVSAALVGLSLGTTYYYRIVGTNSSGTSKGNIANFIPDASPVVYTDQATQAGASANLNGRINSNGLPTEAWFEWGLQIFSNSTTPQSIGSGITEQAVASEINGLVSGTYIFRVWARNSAGTSRGEVKSLIIDSKPIITGRTSIPTATRATLIGGVIPNGLPTTVWFERSNFSTMLDGDGATSPQSIGAGTTSVEVTYDWTGLQEGRGYYYKVVASNASGTIRSSMGGFNALNHPPTVTTTSPIIGSRSLTVRGQVYLNGLATTVWFEGMPYISGACSGSTYIMPYYSAGSGVDIQAFSSTWTGLSPSVGYCYRIMAENIKGLTLGNVVGPFWPMP